MFRFLIAAVTGLALCGALQASQKREDDRSGGHRRTITAQSQHKHDWKVDWHKGGVHHIPGVTRPANQPRIVFRPDVTKGKPIAPVHLGIVRVQNYHLRYGVAFPVGHKMHGHFYYQGYNHRHWTSWDFYPAYGTYLYWCPNTLAWYYWCAPDLSYYPVSYVPYGSYVVDVPQVIPAPPPPPLPPMPPAIP